MCVPTAETVALRKHYGGKKSSKCEFTQVVLSNTSWRLRGHLLSTVINLMTVNHTSKETPRWSSVPCLYLDKTKTNWFKTLLKQEIKIIKCR